MTVISQPSVTVNILPAADSVSNEPQRILFVGQKTAAGTATSGELQESIGNLGEEDTLFGSASILAQIVRRAKGVQQITQMDAIALDDAAGTASTAVIAFSGTASADGEYIITVGSRKNYSVTVAVADTDAATAIGDAVVTALTIPGAPFTAANVTGTVTVTATNLGTVGDNFGIEIQNTVPDVTVVLTGWTGGATDPTLTGVLDVIEGRRYQSVVWQSNFDLSAIQTEMDSRFNVTNDVLNGEAFVAINDTLSNVKALGNTYNSQSLAVGGFKKTDTATYKAPSPFEFNDVIAANVAAIRGLRLTDGSNIAQFVVGAGGVNDATGGAASASMPYFNTPFANLPVIDTGKGWSSTEVEELLTAGVYTIGNNKAGNQVISGEVVTTYKTDAAANPDITWKYLNYVDTASGAREYIFNNLKSDFAQHRLTDGDLVAGRKMANATSIRGAIKGYYQVLSGSDFVLLQAGEAALKFFDDNLDVAVDLASGSVTIGGQLPIMTQLRTINSNFQITFDLN